MLKGVIAGAARELRPWLRLHDQGNHIGRHPAGQQVGVSGVRQQGELHRCRDLERGKDLVPPHVLLLRGMERTG